MPVRVLGKVAAQRKHVVFWCFPRNSYCVTVGSRVAKVRRLSLGATQSPAFPFGVAKRVGDDVSVLPSWVLGECERKYIVW